MLSSHCSKFMVSDFSYSLGNTIFEPGKEGSHYRGSGSGSGDKEESSTQSKDQEKKEEGAKGSS